MDTKKKHHYVSQFYLRGFTSDGHKLSCFDTKTFNFYGSNTKDVGYEKFFNRIDDLGTHASPDFLEDVLGILEGKIAPSINNIEETHGFTGDDRDNIIMLMTLFFLRNPYQRSLKDLAVDQTSKAIFDMVSSCEDGLKVNDIEITPAVKTLLKNNDNFTVGLTREAHIGFEMEMLKKTCYYLSQRKWTLISAPDESFFITSDKPVVLRWKKIEGAHQLPPGLCCKKTLVIFPVSKNFALIGDYEDESEIKVTPELIAFINTNTLGYAARKIFAPNYNFLYINDSNAVDYFVRYKNDLEQAVHPKC